MTPSLRSLRPHFSSDRKTSLDEAGSKGSPVDAARGVLERQLGPLSSRFDLATVPPVLVDGRPHETYELQASGGRVQVRGSSGVALCRGAYAYLRECRAMITWGGSHLDLPSPLPDFGPRRVTCPYRHVQYLNPCTYGYTMAYWDWSRWERELDWMALHGITMPLAMEGQEWIWQQVWLSFGLSQSELDRCGTGPAHLPWHRMGNINHLDGPLTQHWLEDRRGLQRKILDRMRALGMQPVAPAFAGFVPEGFLRVRSAADYFTLLWLPDEFKTIPRSTRTFLLHPAQEDLYREIGRRFIETYKAEYGEVSYYLADTFNELAVPVRPGHRYEDLERFGRTVYAGIEAGDPNGAWVMQSWLFVYDSAFWDNASVEALLRGAPSEKLLILDYSNDLAPDVRGKYSPRQWKVQHAFFGKQWVLGMAHTFGGNNNVKGDLPLIASEAAAVLANPERGKLVGWGICPEGIENNEVVYELMTDIGWSTGAIDLSAWLPAYCNARYGGCPPAMQHAWELLLKSAYSSHVWMTKQAWQAEPGFAPAAVSVNSGPVFLEAVDAFMSCANDLGEKQFYRKDAIELVTQLAGGYVDNRLALAAQALQSDRKEESRENAQRALTMLGRMDALLNLRPDRRLESWVGMARAHGADDAEAAQYDANARRLITTWGWPELSDYASRVWSGLIRDYYAARWRAWFESQWSGSPFSLDLWQQSWLSRPYKPSEPAPVVDMFREIQTVLEECSRAT